MYAIIENGGKQYRVSEGDLIDLERFKGEIGEQVSFDRVLLVGDGETSHLGTPLLAKGQVVGTIAEQGKQGKVIVFKFKRRKGYRRKRGHRQLVTTVRIEKIALGAKPRAESKPAAEKAPKTEEKQPQKKTKKAAAAKAKGTEKKTTQAAANKKTSPKKTVKKKTAAAAKGASTPKKTASRKKTTKAAKKSTKKKV